MRNSAPLPAPWRPESTGSTAVCYRPPGGEGALFPVQEGEGGLFPVQEWGRSTVTGPEGGGSTVPDLQEGER